MDQLTKWINNHQEELDKKYPGEFVLLELDNGDIKVVFHSPDEGLVLDEQGKKELDAIRFISLGKIQV